jgi:hypothetical protein
MCKYCGRTCLTHEKDRLFCTNLCDLRFHNKGSPATRKKAVRRSKCHHCGEFLSSKGLRKRKFCNAMCRETFAQKNKPVKETPTKRHTLPYHVLNEISEKKRVREIFNKNY